MKISITNIVALNGGDAAIVYGMAKAFRAKYGDNVKLKLFASHPIVCQKLYPEFEWQETLGLSCRRTRFNNIRYLGRIFRIIKRYRFFIAATLMRYNKSFAKFFLNRFEYNAMLDYATSDYIISTGGTYLIEPYGIITQYIDYKIALILGRRLGLYTQSMGPFTKPMTIKYLTRIFNKVDFILFRDEKSKENVEVLNLIEKPYMNVVADAAFALGDVSLIENRSSDYIGQKKKVAISVRHFIDKELSLNNYSKGLANTIHYLVNNNYKIYFFSTCQGIPEYDDDTEVVSQVLSYVSPDDKSNVINITKHISIPELLSLLKEMDFIIATRLHMSILSLIVGTPVFPIAYEFKTEELFHMLGYKKVMKMENIKEYLLQEEVDNFIEIYDSHFRLEVNKKVISLIKESIDVARILQ